MMIFRPALTLSIASVVALGLAGCGSESTSTSSTSNPTVGVLTALSGHDGAPGKESWTAWPQALHDAQHSGAATSVGPSTNHLRWTRKLEGNVTPGPVIAEDGTIYAASNAGVLHAIDPRTGRDVWTVDEHSDYGIDQSTSPAVLPNAMVLWPGPGGNLIAVSPSGEVLWRLKVGGQVTSPAVQSSGAVVVGNASGLLIGLRPSDAGPQETWWVDLAETSFGSPVYSTDGATSYQSVESGVVAVKDGRVAWHSPKLKMVEVSPAVAPDGTVVIGTNDRYQYGLEPSDGKVRWRTLRGFITYSSPGVTDDGIAYFGDHGNKIVGLDQATGKRVFGFQGSRKKTNPAGSVSGRRCSSIHGTRCTPAHAKGWSTELTATAT